MHDLCAVPKKFDLPVIFGFAVREQLEKLIPNLSKADLVRNAQVYAALICTIQIEMFMQKSTPDGEVAMLVYEDNRTCRSFIRKSHNFFRLVDPSPVLPPELRGFYPVKRIIDTAHFADKTDSSLIQLADTCAFVMKRRLMKTPESFEMSEPLLSQLGVPGLVPEA